MAAKILKVYTCEHNYPRPRFRPSWRQRRRQLSLKDGVAGIKVWSDDWCLLLAHSPYRWQFLFSFISRTITLRAPASASGHNQKHFFWLISPSNAIIESTPSSGNNEYEKRFFVCAHLLGQFPALVENYSRQVNFVCQSTEKKKWQRAKLSRAKGDELQIGGD